jgi:ribosomal protein S18 acetylase RimI-like enzyme
VSTTAALPALRLRPLTPGDVARVTEIDARHRGRAVPGYWRRVAADFLTRDRERVRVAGGVEREGRLVGYALGEVRAFEFGSEPCGWIFAVGVDPAHARLGIGSALLTEVCRRFRRAGIERVRTMVRRTDVPVLSYFRAHGFTAGEFSQLELELPPEVP